MNDDVQVPVEIIEDLIADWESQKNGAGDLTYRAEDCINDLRWAIADTKRIARELDSRRGEDYEVGY